MSRAPFSSPVKPPVREPRLAPGAPQRPESAARRYNHGILRGLNASFEAAANAENALTDEDNDDSPAVRAPVRSNAAFFKPTADPPVYPPVRSNATFFSSASAPVRTNAAFFRSPWPDIDDEPVVHEPDERITDMPLSSYLPSPKAAPSSADDTHGGVTQIVAIVRLNGKDSAPQTFLCLCNPDCGVGCIEPFQISNRWTDAQALAKHKTKAEREKELNPPGTPANMYVSVNECSRAVYTIPSAIFQQHMTCDCGSFQVLAKRVAY